MAFRVPRFDRSIPIVEDNRTPTLPFHQWWNTAALAIERAIIGIQDALAAAGIALDAAATAQAAAEAANTAATNAQNSANSSASVAKLANSGVADCTITGEDTGTDAVIFISNHIRLYADGTQVTVNAGGIGALAYDTDYFVYYDDPDFAGGDVDYAATTSEATAAQTGVRHLVGSCKTPVAGGSPIPGFKLPPPGIGGL